MAISLSVFVIKKFWQHGILGKIYAKFLLKSKRARIICRFYPSCSNYTILAIEKYGLFIGTYLSCKRIKRCNDRNTDTCIDYP
ncbi:MAG: membrane protein insertion efficiency factor YidD [Candidatus Ratteibacteria bacterium]